MYKYHPKKLVVNELYAFVNSLGEIIPGTYLGKLNVDVSDRLKFKPIGESGIRLAKYTKD